MTEVRVDNITDAAGTGKPDFEDGITYEGAALSALNTHEYSTSEPASPKNGSIWYDSGTIKIYVNGDWYTVNLNASASSIAWYGDRGVFAGGYNGSTGVQNTIDYVDITTAGNATDFGDLGTARSQPAGASDATYGLIMGGFPSWETNAIDYITIATTGNTTDFGDLTVGRGSLAGLSDGTYGIAASGYAELTSYMNVIDYVTIASPGNATDFGDLTITCRYASGLADSTRGVINLGQSGTSGNYVNTLEYITTATPGNSSDFGDMTVAQGLRATASDTTRGLFAGGFDGSNRTNVIDYITIQTTGNATDFGDLALSLGGPAGSSNGTRMVIGGGNYISTNITYTNNIDYVVIQTTGNAQDFGTLTVERNTLAGFSGAAS